jgi:hypothetical protein
MTLRPISAETGAVQNPALILQKMYRASGGDRWNRLAQAELSGTYIIGGMKGTFQQAVDLQHGRDVLTYNVGPLQGKQATLPRSSWEVDRSGLSMLHDGPEAVADAITQSFQDRNGWFRPMDADATFMGQKENAGHRFDLIRIIPPGGRDITLWIDTEDHLLKRLVQKGADHQESTIYISDYRRVDGVLYPFSTRQSSGDVSQDTVQLVKAVRFSSEIDGATFLLPTSPVTDARMLGKENSDVVPFTIADGRIVVDVSINGHPALPFLLDTGAGNLITPEAAKQVGIEGNGSVALTGVGPDQGNGQFATIKELRLGSVQMSNQQFGVAQLPSFLQDRGNEPPIAGLIGYELLRRFPATFDYDAREVTFYKPGSTFDAPLASQQLRLYFNDHSPFIQVGVDGTSAYFGIDTGDSSVTTIFGSFYEAHLFPVMLPVQERPQGGFGGQGRAVITRIGALSFGSWTLQRPLINLNFATTGLFSYSYTGGNLGYRALRNFMFTLDYARHIAYLKKARVFGEPERYNRSGMTFHRTDGGKVIVERVNPNTPAAESGIKIGDRILSLNGQTPEGQALYQFEDALSEQAGYTTHIRYMRGDKEQIATLMLRELIPIGGNFTPYQK